MHGYDPDSALHSPSLLVSIDSLDTRLLESGGAGARLELGLRSLSSEEVSLCKRMLVSYCTEESIARSQPMVCLFFSSSSFSFLRFVSVNSAIFDAYVFLFCSLPPLSTFLHNDMNEQSLESDESEPSSLSDRVNAIRVARFIDSHRKRALKRSSSDVNSGGSQLDLEEDPS